MGVSLTLLVLIAVLMAVGVALILERSLTRILLGFVMIGNALNLFFVVSAGEPGAAPIIGSGWPMSDPLPQALTLTAIVITLGTTAFGLALAFRAFQIQGSDDVQDDIEDSQIRLRARLDETSSTYDESADTSPEEEGADT